MIIPEFLCLGRMFNNDSKPTLFWSADRPAPRVFHCVDPFLRDSFWQSDRGTPPPARISRSISTPALI